MAEVFQKLLNMSIAAGWLILAVVVLRFVLKKAPKRFVLLLWAVVGLRLALPWSIESALSLIPSAATLPEGIMMERTPSLDTGITALNNAINPGFAAAFAPEPAASANPLQVLLPIASALWLAVSVLMLLWALLSYMRLRHSVAEAVRVEGNVYECGRVASPFVLGLFRPRIYLPLGLSDGARAQVLAHEQAHIARGDHIIKPLGWLILSAHWYNPLVWLAYALFCRDIELACDERVIRSMPAAGRADYSQALLDLSRPRHSVGACPLAFGEASVKGRVKSVLSYKKPAFWLVVLAIVVCIGAAVCFLTDPKAKEDAGDADTVTIAAQLPKFIPDAADGIAESAPGPVLEAAQARVLELAAGLDVVDISAAEITTLELCAETPCPDGGTLYLYGLAASFYADGDWFTLLKSGLPTDYLLMLCKDGVWEWLGTADRDTVMGGDGYGGNYPAAVTGEYARIKAAQTPVIRLADGLDALPEQLIGFACGGVDMLAETSGFDITEIEINVLELVTELEAPEGGTLCLYRLGARYKLADGNNAMPAGGMVIENGWITRLHSGGDCYMLLLRDGEVWSYIGILSELTVTELGGDYDAAALDLYERIFAGGVNWTSNLAVSSLYGIQFMFDFDFDWTRIEASCNAGWLQDSRVNYNGQSLSLEPGLELRWMPDTDTASTTIYFTVYNGDEAQYSGSISITRIAQPSLIENTYRAILNCPGLTMTAKGSNMGALISPAE